MWSVIRCAQSAWNRYLMLTDRTVSFLQVERLQEVRASAAERFRTARPFPHVILDGLFNADLLMVSSMSSPAPPISSGRGPQQARSQACVEP